MDSTGKNSIEILIVEDSPTQEERLRYILYQRGYIVRTARNGKQALTLLGEHLPALIITDVVMPEMTGYELCQRIKTDTKLRHIPVVLLTSLATSTDVFEGLACGADNFITKPYSEDYLLSSLDQIIASSAPPKTVHKCEKMEIMFAGKRRSITADRQQMLTMLLSTYAATANKSAELLQAQETLRLLNQNLESLVEQRTEALTEEIAKRRRDEEELARQLDELRRWQAVTLGRESRIGELKREVNALAARLGSPLPYVASKARGPNEDE